MALEILSLYRDKDDIEALIWKIEEVVEMSLLEVN